MRRKSNIFYKIIVTQIKFLIKHSIDFKNFCGAKQGLRGIAIPPPVGYFEKIEKKVEKEKYEEILEDKDGKYTNSAKKKALGNKEFA